MRGHVFLDNVRHWRWFIVWLHILTYYVRPLLTIFKFKFFIRYSTFWNIVPGYLSVGRIQSYIQGANLKGNLTPPFQTCNILVCSFLHPVWLCDIFISYPFCWGNKMLISCNFKWADGSFFLLSRWHCCITVVSKMFLLLCHNDIIDYFLLLLYPVVHILIALIVL